MKRREANGLCHCATVGGVSMSPSLAGIVPARLLDEGETVILAIKPSLWFVLFSSARVVGLMVLVMGLTPYFAGKFDGEGIWRSIMYWAGVLAALRLAYAFLEWMSRLYVLTDRRVMRIKGVFNVDVFECHLTRIQNTFLTLALHERVFRLGSIQFATAGTGAIEAAWLNINDPLKIHETVRQAIDRARKRLDCPGV